MQAEERKTHSFFKGISLSEYMRDVCCPEEDEDGGDNEDTNDLLLECEQQPNIADCAIREIMDEDNYDESNDQQELIIQPLHVLPPYPEVRSAKSQNLTG